MDALAHLPAVIRARRALLNDTIRSLPDLFDGRGVTLFDPASMLRLKAAGQVPRTLLHSTT
jgi:hypothetical protein